MCCNADILFCVLVLHWVSSKEVKEDHSAYRSESGTHNNTALGSVHATATRSRRASTGLDAKFESAQLDSLAPTSPVVMQTANPFDAAVLAPETSRHVPATIITECKSDVAKSKVPKVSHRIATSRDTAADDEVELRNIMVHTVQTREVEIDGSGHEGSESIRTDRSNGELDEWVSSERRVVGERIV